MNIYSQLQAIVLAAGKSSRFNTIKSKLAHTICGLEMIAYPVKLLSALTENITLVVGHQQEVIKDIMAQHVSVNYVEQKEQAGTGHALLCTQELWNKDYILVINGDMPLVTLDVLQNLLNAHMASKAVMSFVTAHNIDPQSSYGRVVKEKDKVRIIEAKNLPITSNFEEYCCINAGIYLFNRSFLETSLVTINKDILTKEIYLTDLAASAGLQNLHVETVSAPFDTIRGINTLKELWTVEHIKRSELINYHMERGVRFVSAQHVHLDYNVHIEADTTIGAGAILRGNTSIGKNSTIDAFCVLDNTRVGDNVTVYSHSVLENCRVEDDAQVGPFARVYKESVIAQHAIVGNFVEVSKSHIGKKSKAKHLAYIGQATIGQNVNIGAGTIVCNYNGVSKHETHIKDGAFIGSNSCLIAPLTIGTSSIIAAGSVITDVVPDNALAIARERQVIKEGYATKLKQKYKASKKTALTSNDVVNL